MKNEWILWIQILRFCGDSLKSAMDYSQRLHVMLLVCSIGEKDFSLQLLLNISTCTSALLIYSRQLCNCCMSLGKLAKAWSKVWKLKLKGCGEKRAGCRVLSFCTQKLVHRARVGLVRDTIFNPTIKQPCVVRVEIVDFSRGQKELKHVRDLCFFGLLRDYWGVGDSSRQIRMLIVLFKWTTNFLC